MCNSRQLPVLWVGVFQQFCQLQRILADLLNRSKQESIQGNVDHLLEQTTGLKKEHILLDLHQFGELHAGIGVVVAILGVDLEVCLLDGKRNRNQNKNQPNQTEPYINTYIQVSLRALRSRSQSR